MIDRGARICTSLAVSVVMDYHPWQVAVALIARSPLLVFSTFVCNDVRGRANTFLYSRYLLRVGVWKHPGGYQF
jgi:hypothetical protein